jgi:hypothetical protein
MTVGERLILTWKRDPNAHQITCGVPVHVSKI